MPSSITFAITKVVIPSQLFKVLQASFSKGDSITKIEVNSDTQELVIETLTTLTDQERDELKKLIENFKSDFSEKPMTVLLDSPATSSDGIPFVYSTSRPMNHYVCFQGAGDSDTKIGGGQRCYFKLNSKTDVISKSFTFNEDVYIKDGYMLTRDAPMGARFDVDILDPTETYVVGTFARQVPIFGTGWFPMDTEDAGLLPKGFILRITAHNANGDVEPDEDFPKDFSMAGRFELYRLEWKYHPQYPEVNR